jgi:hypothetical protein
MLAEKSVPFYFEPAPSVQYNGISYRLSEQCRAMIVENAGNQTANQKKALNVRIISGPK